VFETAECEEVRNSIFWELRYEKHENQTRLYLVFNRMKKLGSFLLAQFFTGLVKKNG